MSATAKPDVEEIQALLAARGLRVSLRQFTELVQEAVARLPMGVETRSSRHDLTAPEAQALERAGFTLDFRDRQKDDPVADTTALYTALLSDSLSTSEAAALLGLNPSRIRQRLLARPRTLYGIQLRSGWRLPRFQFAGRQLVPGIDEVITALDPELHPVAVVSWFTSPNPDLSIEREGEEPVLLRPLQWLSSGQSPSQAAELAANL
jgi:hypothetical protein